MRERETERERGRVRERSFIGNHEVTESLGERFKDFWAQTPEAVCTHTVGYNHYNKHERLRIFCLAVLRCPSSERPRSSRTAAEFAGGSPKAGLSKANAQSYCAGTFNLRYLFDCLVGQPLSLVASRKQQSQSKWCQRPCAIDSAGATRNWDSFLLARLCTWAGWYRCARHLHTLLFLLLVL